LSKMNISHQLKHTLYNTTAIQLCSPADVSACKFRVELAGSTYAFLSAFKKFWTNFFTVLFALQTMHLI